MKRASVTFAEIFIVLALVFLIQTVANFNLFEGNTNATPARMIMLSARQVPSGGSNADHLRYITVRSNTATRTVARGIGSSEIAPSAITNRITSSGSCSTESIPQGTVKFCDRSDGACIESFLSAIDPGLTVTQVNVSGIQNEYVFSWDPEEVDPSLVIDFGMVHCHLSSSPGALKIDPAWNLNSTDLSYPHPLIIDVTRLTDFIENQPPIVRYAHMDQLPERLTNLAMPKYVDVVINSSGQPQKCSLPQVGGNSSRKYLARQVSVSLGDL